MSLIIQEFSRSGRLIKEQKFTQFPISIGRGYDNDLRIDDPHIAANQARIEVDQDGLFHLHDLNSLNATKDQRGSPIRHCRINSGDIFSVANVQIKVLKPDHPVAPTVKLSALEPLAEFLNRKRLAVFLMAIFIAAFIGLKYLTSVSEFSIKNFFNPLIAGTLSVMLWPLFWSMMSRFFKHESRFFGHLSCFLMALIILESITLIRTILIFNQFSLVAEVVDYLLSATLIFCLLYISLYLFGLMQGRQRLIRSGVFTLLIFLLLYATQVVNQREFSATPQYDSVFLPSQFMIAPGLSQEDYVKATESLYKTAQQEAASE